METIGRLNDRDILYTHARSNANWAGELPDYNWLAFTYANNDDRALLNDVVEKCLDHHVSYTCSAGDLADLTDDLFDQEIVYRRLLLVENQSSEEQVKYNQQLLMTSFFEDITESFWYANNQCYAPEENSATIERIVCIDLSESSIKEQLKDLIERFNNGWLPPEF